MTPVGVGQTMAMSSLQHIALISNMTLCILRYLVGQ